MGYFPCTPSHEIPIRPATPDSCVRPHCQSVKEGEDGDLIKGLATPDYGDNAATFDSSQASPVSNYNGKSVWDNESISDQSSSGTSVSLEPFDEVESEPKGLGITCEDCDDALSIRSKTCSTPSDYEVSQENLLVFHDDCLQCVEKGMKCSKAWPTCSRCARSGELCLTQRRIIPGRPYGWRWERRSNRNPFLVKLKVDTSATWSKKRRLEDEYNERRKTIRDQLNWVLPSPTTSPRGLFSFRSFRRHTWKQRDTNGSVSQQDHVRMWAEDTARLTK